MDHIFDVKVVRSLPRVKERNRSKKNELKRGVDTFHALGKTFGLLAPHFF